MARVPMTRWQQDANHWSSAREQDYRNGKATPNRWSQDAGVSL